VRESLDSSRLLMRSTEWACGGMRQGARAGESPAPTIHECAWQASGQSRASGKDILESGEYDAQFN